MHIAEQRTVELAGVTLTRYQLATPHDGNVAVSYLPAASDVAVRGHLVFNAGMFSNRRFWLSDKGIGLAAHLSKQGYGCWMLDRRGLGASPDSPSRSHTLFNAIEFDLPATQQLLREQGVESAFYIGHSFGGVINSLSVARGHLDAKGVSGIINVSSQLTVGKRFLNKPYSALLYGLTGLLNHFPSRLLKMGPENESKQAMRDACTLVSLAKGKRTQAMFWQRVHQIECPVLGIGAKGDTVDPPSGCEAFIRAMGSNDKTFVVLAKENGHLRDYDHVSMVVSKDAQQEVWPLISNWLNAHTERV